MHVRSKIKSLLSRRTKACDEERGPSVRQPDHKQQEGVDSFASSSKANEGHYLPGQSGLSISNPPPITKASDVPINELWSVAYEHLRDSDGDLIADYEDRLRGNFAIGLGSTLGSRADVRDKMKTILQRKMDEVNRDAWKLKFRSSEVQIKDLVQPVLGVVNWANDYVSAAVGANPSASIAWAGISLLLPLFLNPSKQAASLANGLEHVSSLIARSYMWESLYIRRCQPDSCGDGPTYTLGIDPLIYKDALELLYHHILRFQITGYCYYASNTAVRLSQDLVKWNEWEFLLSKIRDQEVTFDAVNAAWRDSTYAEEYVAAQRRHEEAVCQWQHIGKDVSSLLVAVKNAQGEKERINLLKWLCTVDPSEAYNAARNKHIGGTSDWLLRESEEYGNWEKSPSSVLWLHGKAGCGKSILSSSVINDIKNRHGSDPQSALAYFFFSFSDSSKQKVDVMLASLVKQLYASRPDTPQAVESLEGYKTRGERPDTKTLESALLATVCGFGATFIIIDALDECPNLDGERDKLMTSFCRIIGAIPNNVHVLCTSRAEADIVAAMNNILGATQPTRAKIDLNEERRRVDCDISLYIESTLASPAYSSWPPDLKEEARESLIENAEGMFQYVSSQFEALQKLSSPKAVRDAIQQLPVGLDATYDRILLSLEPNYRTQIASSLQWLASSTRDLTVEELAEVFILRPNSDVPFDETDRLFKPEDWVKYLSNLVVTEVHPTDDGELSQEQEAYKAWDSQYQVYDTYVRLAHFTVKEYLISDRIIRGPAASFSFTETGAHLHVARSCLFYYLHYQDPTEEVRNGFKLNYAFKHWAFHVEMVPRELWSPELVRLALRGLAECSKADRLDKSSSWHPLLPHAATLDGPHFYTVRKGFPQLTGLLLDGGPGMNPYLTQQDLNMALREAAEAGRMTVVQLLLARGADSNAENEMHGGSLQAAARGGHTEIVEILLDTGANIDAHHGQSGSALQAAVRGFQSDVIQLLLDRGAIVGCALITACGRLDNESDWECLHVLLDSGADVNRQCDIHGTALHQVASEWNCQSQYTRKAFRLLLERGADPNLPGGKYGYPLQAVIHGFSDISDVMLLMDWGANVDAQGGKYGSALQALFDFDLSPNRKEVAEVLLEGGADINMQGGLNGSALHGAAMHGIGGVRFLLENGADMSIYDGRLGSVFHAACSLGNLETVRFFLNKGFDVNAQGGKHGSALQSAAVEPYYNLIDRGEILRLLLSRGADVNAVGGHYGTALQAACQASPDPIDNVRILLDHGADVNVLSGKYGTALQAACLTQNEPDVALLLIENGADVHLHGGEFGSAWHAAAGNMGYRTEEILDLLLERGVDIDEVRGGRHGTALQVALELEYRVEEPRLWTRFSSPAERVEFLLDHGADVNIGGGKYAFPLQSACAKEDNSTLTRYLLESCPNIDVNAAGGLFGSALQAAVHSRQEDSVRLLLEKGAEINARGGRYGSALNAAVFRGFWEIVELLLDRGAIPDSQQLPEPDEQWLAGVRAAFADEEWVTDDYFTSRGLKVPEYIITFKREFIEKQIALVRVDASRAAVERYSMFWERTRTVGDRAHVRSEN